MQDMLHAGDFHDMEEPDFMFGDDGDIIELTADKVLPRTPSGQGTAAMQTDARASEKVRREHEEGRGVVAKVCFTVFSHVLRYPSLTALSLI